METYFATNFKDIRHERSFLILAATDSEVLKQNKFTDHELNLIQNLDLEKIHSEKKMKEYNCVL